MQQTPETVGSRPGSRHRELRTLIRDLDRMFEEHARRCVADLGLTLPQATALRDLDTPRTMRELAGIMCCEPSNVTFVIDRLADRGLVERKPHPTDRRAKMLALTPEGAVLREQLLERAAQQAPLADLGEEQTARLCEALHAALKSSRATSA
ncbi:MarR family winged helix-turn-helix transcriptional regulator [Streptomyces sp. NPDC059894]|uniref:MarR family winged helix-turn-helix transcriptional regulator n=1 Tax=unclassified Streptomyces TaxID=2593676 RepID=UPI0036628A29